MFKIFIVATLVAAIRASTTHAEDPTKGKPMKLEGTYTIVSGERDGKAIPADHLTGSLVILSGDKIVGTDKDKKQFFSCTYVVDAGASPMKITMKSTPMGQAPKDPDANTPETPGLIAADNATLTVIYALPGGKAPTELKTKVNQHLFVMKRVEMKK